MTQEENLLLKDLSARLPHRVICHANKINIDGELIFVNRLYSIAALYYDNAVGKFESCPINDIKPYLRPISSMTEKEMDQLFDILHIDKDGNDEDWIKINDVLGIKFFFRTGKWVENVAEAYDYLNSIHINYRLPKHLFIEVTNENNPYENDI